MNVRETAEPWLPSDNDSHSHNAMGACEEHFSSASLVVFSNLPLLENNQLNQLSHVAGIEYT